MSAMIAPQRSGLDGRLENEIVRARVKIHWRVLVKFLCMASSRRVGGAMFTALVVIAFCAAIFGWLSVMSSPEPILVPAVEGSGAYEVSYSPTNGPFRSSLRIIVLVVPFFVLVAWALAVRRHNQVIRFAGSVPEMGSEATDEQISTLITYYWKIDTTSFQLLESGKLDKFTSDERA